MSELTQFLVSQGKCLYVGSEWVCWVPPPPNVLKANFDAASWEDSRSSAACVVRDHAGTLLLAAGFLCDRMAIEDAEMRTAWETIHLLRAYYPDSQVWVEEDALAIIQCLHASDTPQGCSMLLEDARWMLSELHVYQVSHTYREGNQCADWITN